MFEWSQFELSPRGTWPVGPGTNGFMEIMRGIRYFPLRVPRHWYPTRRHSCKKVDFRKLSKGSYIPPC